MQIGSTPTIGTIRRRRADEADQRQTTGLDGVGLEASHVQFDVMKRTQGGGQYDVKIVATTAT
jgi:hypothetical protein